MIDVLMRKVWCLVMLIADKRYDLVAVEPCGQKAIFVCNNSRKIYSCLRYDAATQSFLIDNLILLLC